MTASTHAGELRSLARRALLLTGLEEKLETVRSLAGRADAAGTDCDPCAQLPPVDNPGRPKRPRLVPPHAVPGRKLASAEGRAALIHAIAHIEFNAVNLALDAVARFGDMPATYYADWLRIAGEEAYHFTLLAGHLRSYGRRYGDFPAHNGLWEMAQKTSADVLTRMALVPRVLEARGLDVTPGIQAKLTQAGDQTASAVLDIILRDEIGHVATGNHWFRHLCTIRGLEPMTTFDALCRQHGITPLHPPVNATARLAAGFSMAELRLPAI